MTNRSYPLIALMLFAIVALIGCGGAAEQNSLESKKQQLTDLRTEVMELNKEIQDLEAEIAEADPDAAKKVKQIAVEISTISLGTFEHTITIQGKVEADQSLSVSPQASGKFMKVNVREGQKVKAGQLLAIIDDAILRKSMAELQTQLDLATIIYEKQKRLWDQKIGTEVQFLTAESNKKALEKSIARLEEQLELYKVTAPTSGTLETVSAKVGEMAAPGFPAFQIVNFSNLSLKANMPENYVPYVKRGSKVKITFPTLEKTIDARVSVVGNTIQPLDRTFSVEVDLPSNSMLKPNMFGELAINDRTVEDAVSIPLGIIQRSEDGQFVYTAEQKGGEWVAKRKLIKTNLNSKGQVLVEEGLNAGDRLITFGFQNLSNGQPIIFEENSSAVAKN